MSTMQNVINGCFAICITLFIYQNQQLKNEISSLQRDIAVINSPYRDAIPLSMVTETFFECTNQWGNILKFSITPEDEDAVDMYRSVGELKYWLEDGRTGEEIYVSTPINRLLKSDSIIYDYFNQDLVFGLDDKYSCDKMN